MKKILILILLVFYNNHASADRLVKNGFLNNEMGYEMDQNINDPKNKIILILNHGQGNHDKKSKDCYYSNNISNFSLLVGTKINEKEWKKKLKNLHYIWEADSFQYYNPTILDYISSRVSS